MPGFCITNCEKSSMPVNFGNAPCIQEQMSADGFTIYRNTRDQFMQDKVFMQDDDCVIVLEGVIMNKKELMERYGGPTFEATVKEMFLADRCRFFSAFRGMFSGAVYDKANKSWTVFVDQTGSRAAFYYAQDGLMIAGSQLNYVTDVMRANALSRQVDENALRQFLRHGCFLDDSTNIKQVKRILPGDCLTAGGGIRVDTYFQFSEETEADISDDEAIKRMDAAFRNAVRLALEKNEEYGYTGVLDLSGGADSRLIAFTAKSLGWKDMIACHYSQTHSNEIDIAQQIASDLDLEFYYHALDDARFMRDAETIIRMNSGTAYYCGITGGKRMLEALGAKDLGIEFTGILGDVHSGAMLPANGMLPPNLNAYTYVKSISPEDVSINTLSRFKTNNAFWFYTRGMLMHKSTFLTRQNYVEPFTPYTDVEFMKAYFSVSWDRMVHDRLQLRWMARKYPEAMKYRYAALGAKLSVSLHPAQEKLVTTAVRGMRYIAKKLGRRTNFDMNPVHYWETKKPWLRPWLEEYYNDKLRAVEQAGILSEPLLELIKQAYVTPGPLNKYIVLTLLGSLNEFVI